VTGSDAVEGFVRGLHDRHAGALYGFALRRLGDRAAAEDAVQDALVAAWRHQSQFDPARGSERQWLFGITRNIVADRRRRDRRRGLRIVATVDEGVDDDDLERVVEVSLVVDALAGLTPEHRSAIVAAYYEGLSTAEIAQRLGVPPGTVKSRLHYGLQALRTSLEETGVLR
jgi:RNA polymerase sigma-70 factor (ECF subfamily)